MVNFCKVSNYQPENFNNDELSILKAKKEDVEKALLALDNKVAEYKKQLVGLLYEVIHDIKNLKDKHPIFSEWYERNKHTLEKYLRESNDFSPRFFIASLELLSESIPKHYRHDVDDTKQTLDLKQLGMPKEKILKTHFNLIIIRLKEIIIEKEKQLDALKVKCTNNKRLYEEHRETIRQENYKKLKNAFKEAVIIIRDDANQRVLNNSSDSEAGGIRGICNELLSNPNLSPGLRCSHRPGFEDFINNYYSIKKRRLNGYADNRLRIIENIVIAHRENLNIVEVLDCDKILCYKAIQDEIASSLINLTKKIIDNMVHTREGRSYLLGSYGINNKKKALIDEINQLNQQLVKGPLGTESILTAYENIKKICAQKRNPIGLFSPHSAKEFDKLTMTVTKPANRSITQMTAALSPNNCGSISCLV